MASERFDFTPLGVPDRVEVLGSWSKSPVTTPWIVYAVNVDVCSSLSRGSHHVRYYMWARIGVENGWDFASQTSVASPKSDSAAAVGVAPHGSILLRVSDGRMLSSEADAQELIVSVWPHI